MKRFCGFVCGRAGDLFMATVTARALKRLEPDCHLTFTIGRDYREAAPLFLNHPHIDRIHILNSTGAGGFDVVDQHWIAGQRFDWVANPLADHIHSDPWWTHRIQPLEICHMHGIPVDPSERGRIEMAQWFDKLPGYKDYVAFAPFPGFYAGLDPAKNDKTLSIDQAQRVVDHLVARKIGVIQIGGPTEPALKGVVSSPRAWSYFDSVQAILSCRLFIGGDTGMTWLMSGYDFNTVAFYGSRYYGRQWVHNIQPINPNGQYVSCDTVAQIELDTLTQAIDNALSTL